jgi:hypothetical protein
VSLFKLQQLVGDGGNGLGVEVDGLVGLAHGVVVDGADERLEGVDDFCIFGGAGDSNAHVPSIATQP